VLVLKRGPAGNPLFGAFFAAMQEAGYPTSGSTDPCLTMARYQRAARPAGIRPGGFAVQIGTD